MMNFSIARCLFSIGGCTTILGNISADTAVSSAGAIGGLGVLTAGAGDYLPSASAMRV